MICIYCGAEKGKKQDCPRCGAMGSKDKGGTDDKNLAVYALYLNRFGLASGGEQK